MLKDFLTDHPLTIRCQLYRVEQELTVNSLKGQGATVEQAPYLPYAFYLSDYSHLEGLKSFVMGRFVVQDVSSMLVTEAADPKPGDYVIDLCAAPGGKSLHMADKMQGQGMVDARDLTDYKVGQYGVVPLIRTCRPSGAFYFSFSFKNLPVFLHHPFIYFTDLRISPSRLSVPHYSNTEPMMGKAIFLKKSKIKRPFTGKFFSGKQP